jgi:hypothetical protein
MNDWYEDVRTMKNAVFWDVTLCCSCKNRRFGQYLCVDSGACASAGHLWLMNDWYEDVRTMKNAVFCAALVRTDVSDSICASIGVLVPMLATYG